MNKMPPHKNDNINRTAGDAASGWVRIDPSDYENGAAARSGLVLVGDQLVAVAGQSILGLPIGEVMERLREHEGTEVPLTFFRGTREQTVRSCSASL